MAVTDVTVPPGQEQMAEEAAEVKIWQPAGKSACQMRALRDDR